MEPKKLQLRLDEIVKLIESFCDSHLNDEYKEVCCDMVEALGEDGFAVDRGKVAGWAAGVVYTVGNVNCLSDPSKTPCMAGKEIAAGFGVSESTMMAKSREIREGLNIIPLHPYWTVESLLETNPLVWMVELKNGLIVDVRDAPLEFQKNALEAGLIPFIPKPRKPDVPRLALVPPPSSENSKKRPNAKKSIESNIDTGPQLF